MKLYTGDNCINCDTAKQITKNKDIDIEIIHIDPTTRKGRDLALQERIMGVPVLDLRGSEVGESQIDRYIGADVVDYLNSL